MPEQSKNMNKADKKSEVLEVRLPHEIKKAFMEACKDKNETASGVLRTLINSFLSHEASHRKFGIKDALYIGLGTVLGAFAYSVVYASLSEPALQSNPLAERYFEHVDTNDDQRVSREEFVSAIISRRTLSTDDIKSDEIVLRTVGVALIIPQTHAASLKKMGRLTDCFSTLAEMGDTERAREFYNLDVDKDNQLTFVEFVESARIPERVDLENEFREKDQNNDSFLDRSEAAEDVKAWTAAYGTPNNTRTSSKEQGVPESCKVPDTDSNIGRLYIKFEQLKRRIDIMTPKAIPLTDGLTNERFEALDQNKDSRISFAEFIRWYL